MNSSKNRTSSPAVALLVSTLVLALSGGVAGHAVAQEPDGGRYTPLQLAYAASQGNWTAVEGSQLPQDIRIMQRIVSTALGEVDAPEIPEALQRQSDGSDPGGGYVYSAGGNPPTVLWTRPGGGNGVYSIGSREVTGFYMQGYGYLFTVKWRLAPAGMAFVASGSAGARAAELAMLAGQARRAVADAGGASEARAAEDAEQALEEERERLEMRQQAWEQWSAEYRSILAEALRDVVALYGSTLKRATPDESITFIADFGGGEEEVATLTARRGDLTGASREENLAAVRVAMGATSVSSTLGTQLKIMAEIIDSSLQVERGGDAWVVAVDELRYFGGDSSYQHVPGYGVLFRKSARLNLATRVIQRANPDRRASGVSVQTLRQSIEETTEEQRELYADHLADLKQKTAEVLATYGPTLTEMGDGDWVGVYYNVGSAAGLLEGGISNFLVQARMADIRQAGGQADGAGWLAERLVTNERQD